MLQEANRNSKQGSAKRKKRAKYEPCSITFAFKCQYFKDPSNVLSAAKVNLKLTSDTLRKV